MRELVRDFFQQSTLFLLKLLRHLVVQILIMLFVVVEIKIHKIFIEQTFKDSKANQAVTARPPAQRKKRHRKLRKKQRAAKQTRGERRRPGRWV